MEGRWPGAGNHVLPGDDRAFITGNRQTKCLGDDRRRTVWCLQWDQLCYLRNRRTKCALTVSCTRPGKFGCRSNWVSFCTVYPTSHVSSEFSTFRCLIGRVCQRDGPVSPKTVGTMFDLVVTSALTSTDVNLTSGSRSPDEADGAAGSVTHSIFVRFTSKFDVLCASSFSPPSPRKGHVTVLTH